MSQANNIGWVETNADLTQLFNNLASSRGIGQNSKVTLGLRGALSGKEITVSSTNATASSAFDTAFDAIAASGSSRNLYHIDNVPETILRGFSSDSQVIQKPAIGLYNPNTQDVLILEKGAFNYGFVNAMALGSFSKFFLDQDAYQYAHAACLSINGKGVLILGDHKAGKSTLVSKILSEAEARNDIALGVVSDDWVLLKENKDQLTGMRVSQEYRIDESTTKNAAIGLSKTFTQLLQQYKPAHSDKASIPIDDLCSRMGLIDLAEHKVDIIFIMDPSQAGYIDAVNLSAAQQIIRASTANVPPLNQGEQTVCDGFWQNQFATHNSVSINNRHSSAPIQKVADDIIKMALK